MMCDLPPSTDPFGFEDPDQAAANRKYGYGVYEDDTAAKYGYEDPDAAAKYGYEDPDAAAKYGYEDPDAAAKYGYEDPDAAANKYGYEDPDAAAKKYGYEDPDQAAANKKYGYEDPDQAAATKQHARIPSRSAMKQPTRIRRASISFGGAEPCGYDDHHVRAPRRSSMKQPGSLRRSSIQFGGEIEVVLPGQKEPVKRRTSVDLRSQEPVVQVVAVEEFDAVAEKEKWMAKEEYDLINKNNSKIVKAIEKGTDKNFCLRGLEGMLPTSSQHKDRVDARAAVLEEQRYQREQGVFDESRMAERYHYVAMQSQLEAAERAETDSAEIEKYLKGTKKMMFSVKKRFGSKMSRRMSA